MATTFLDKKRIDPGLPYFDNGVSLVEWKAEKIQHNDASPEACDRVLARITKRNLTSTELYFLLLEETETVTIEGDKE